MACDSRAASARSLKLAVDWEQHLDQEEPRGLVLPQIVPQRVEYYTGLIAVEGHPELETTVVKHPRQVDEGELSVAEYQVGTRLVGAYEFLEPAAVVIDVTRHPGHALPSALAQRVQLVTQLSMRDILKPKPLIRFVVRMHF